MTETCTVDDLFTLVNQGRTFSTIYADPPWKYQNQATRASAEKHYPTMTMDALASLPVASLAAEQCHLWLWTTGAFLFECPRLFDAWGGFDFQCHYIWVKPQMGLGNYLRMSHELLLLAVRGGLPAIDESLEIGSWGLFKRGKHSVKPEAIRTEVVERISPGPRLELFARQPATGWVVWGNEIQKDMFDIDGTTIRTPASVELAHNHWKCSHHNGGVGDRV